MSLIEEVVENFRKNYDALCTDDLNSPAKSVIVDAEDLFNDVVTSCTANLRGTTINGTETEKIIFTDDLEGITDETIFVNGEEYKDIGLTKLRCVAMAIVAIEKTLGRKPNKVGFIGNGSINQAITKGINEHFCTNSFVIRGSNKNREKNLCDFMLYGNVFVDNSDDLRYLNDCDVVIVCTTSVKKEYQISSDLLNNVPVIISLDSGYLLDESFRRDRVSYTDHRSQLDRLYMEEFPFDKEKYKILQLPKEGTSEKCVVYLEGTGLADASAMEVVLRRLYGL